MVQRVSGGDHARLEAQRLKIKLKYQAHQEEKRRSPRSQKKSQYRWKNKLRNYKYLNEVFGGHGRVGALAIRNEAGNGDATVVVSAHSADERVADGSALALEATSGTSVDNKVGLGLVDGVERREGTCHQ